MLGYATKVLAVLVHSTKGGGDGGLSVGGDGTLAGGKINIQAVNSIYRQ